jgi:hypothetical protein
MRDPARIDRSGGDQPVSQSGKVTLELTPSEAVVLFGFVNRFSVKDRLTLEDPAEAQVLYNLCCLLEKLDKWLMESHRTEWPVLLERARRAVRPTE